MQTYQACDRIRKDMNEKFIKEWQVIILKNNSGWAYNIWSDENDQMAINFDYKGLQHVLIFKSPEERDD